MPDTIKILAQGGTWPTLDRVLAERPRNDKFLWTTFYHLVHSARSETARKRIYLHLATPYVVRLPGVLERLLPMLIQIESMTELKVTGPGGAGRKDQIIVYLSEVEGQNPVLGQIADLDPRYFAPGVPMGTQEVAKGVAIADEPPHVRLVPRDDPVQSFGGYLAKAIYWAVEEAGPDPEQEEFFDLAGSALQVAGIDPTRPHLHPRRRDIEELARRGLLARRRRRSASDSPDPLQAATDAATDAVT